MSLFYTKILATLRKTYRICPMPVKTLSADSLFTIKGCIDNHIARLTKLHWAVCPFMPTTQNKKGENAVEVLKNIGREQANLIKAKKELIRLRQKDNQIYG